MTETQKEKYKQLIYDPYTEAWIIMRTLRDSDLSDKAWTDFVDSCKKFKNKYPTEIGESLYGVLLDVSELTGRISKE